MREMIDVRGVSGTVYRFTQFRDGRPLSAMGGNFVYVREAGEGYEILFAGQTPNLLTGARMRWDEAAAGHGAAHLFTRLNIAELDRQREHADIVEAIRPAMNPLVADQAI